MILDKIKMQTGEAILGELTYDELLAAAFEKSKSIKKSDIILIPGVRTSQFIIDILACWEAGAAFCPVDPSWPYARKLLIEKKVNEAKKTLKANNLAYVIFTSGSTGEPKGVMVPHDGIEAMIENQIELFKLKKTDIGFWCLNPAFDASLSDILCVLRSGAALKISKNEPHKWLEEMKNSKVTVADVPPSWLETQNADDCGTHLKTIVIGGEACKMQVVRAWAEKVNLVNVYGPTEATVCTSAIVCTNTWEDPLIGSPLSGVEYHVNEGELLIHSNGLMLGYAGEPELTADAFTFINNKKYYRTKDLVKETAEGLVFEGRKDRQIKLKGQLIAPEEIERALVKHPDVKTAIVEKQGNILVARLDANPKDIKKFCEVNLPAYLVPGKIEELGSKVEKTSSDKKDIEQTLLRSQIGSILETITGTRFTDTSNFFDEGLDSLGVILLATELQSLGYNFEVEEIVGAASIEKLLLKASRPISTEKLKEFAVTTKYPYVSQTSHPKNILLTGATGFLGSRVLDSLLEKDVNVTCIVRAKNQKHAEKRIGNRNVKVVKGDITAPGFGCDFIENIDTIIHSAADVNITKSFGDLKTTNVDPLHEIIKFQHTGNQKNLFHISTLSTFVNLETCPQKIKEVRALPGRLHGGYAQSKWCAEELLEQSGTNFSIIRPGMIIDENAMEDWLSKLIRSLKTLGAAPVFSETREIDFTPARWAATTIADICTSENPEKYYNVSGRKPIKYKELLGALPELKLLDETEFKTKMQNTDARYHWGVIGLLEKNNTAANMFLSTNKRFEYNNLQKTLNIVPPTISKKDIKTYVDKVRL